MNTEEEFIGVGKKEMQDQIVKPKIKFGQIVNKILYDRVMLLIAMIFILVITMSIAFPEFPTWPNFAAVMLDIAQSGIITTGMLILLICGVFDLSAGNVLALSGIVAAIFVQSLGAPVLISILAGVLTGLVAGLINGLIITKFRINALIATLATSGILRGITQIISPSGVANLPDSFKSFGQSKFLGLQSPFWYMFIIAIIVWFLLSRSRFFRQFYYLGSNQKAATLSGINTHTVIIAAFTIMGTLAGFAGVLLASRLSNAVLLAGTGVEMRAITAAIVGGASLSGGKGTVFGALLGVLFVSLIQNALIIMRVPVFYQGIVVGLVLLVAIGIDQFGHSNK